jgi:hypothetical protein
MFRLCCRWISRLLGEPEGVGLPKRLIFHSGGLRVLIVAVLWPCDEVFGEKATLPELMQSCTPGN